MIKKIDITVFGNVQGRGFRLSAQMKARRLGLVGWVRNEADGSVKILAEGEENNLFELIDWCKSNPGFAKVARVEVKWKQNLEGFKTFEIKRE